MARMLVNIAIACLRDVVDCFGIYGFGLYFVGWDIRIRKLLLLSLRAALMMAPIRFLPISMGTQVMLVFLLMIVLLVKYHVPHVLASAGAVLIGSWSMAVLEAQFHILNQPTDLISGMIYSTPAAVVLAVTALWAQNSIRGAFIFTFYLARHLVDAEDTVLESLSQIRRCIQQS